VTGGVFVAVTGYVMFSKEKFSAPAGLLTGMFFALIIAMFVNSFLQLSGLGLLITIGIGIFGVVSLVYATSDVLNNPSYDNPVQGALMPVKGDVSQGGAMFQLDRRLDVKHVDVVVQDMNFRANATSGEEGVALFRALRALDRETQRVILWRGCLAHGSGEVFRPWLDA